MITNNENIINDDTSWDINESNNEQSGTVNNPVPENESVKEKSGNSIQKNVVTGVAGVAVGAAGVIAAMSFKHSEEPMVNPTPQPLPVIEPLQFDGAGVPVAQNVNNDMSFSEAFASARHEVGPGGVFQWREGIYGTYYANEWKELSDEYKHAFSNYAYNIKIVPYHADTLIAAEPSDTTPQPELKSSGLPVEELQVVDKKAVAELPEEEPQIVDKPAVAELPEEELQVVDEPAVAELPEEELQVVDEPALAEFPEEELQVVDEPALAELPEEELQVIEEPALAELPEEELQVIDEPALAEFPEEEFPLEDEPAVAELPEEELQVIEEPALAEFPVEEFPLEDEPALAELPEEELQSLDEPVVAEFPVEEFPLENEPALAELPEEELQSLDEPVVAELPIEDKPVVAEQAVIDVLPDDEDNVVIINAQNVIVANANEDENYAQDISVVPVEVDGQDVAVVDTNLDDDYNITVVDDDFDSEQWATDVIEDNDVNIAEEYQELPDTPIVTQDSVNENINPSDYISDFSNNEDISDF